MSRSSAANARTRAHSVLRRANLRETSRSSWFGEVRRSYDDRRKAQIDSQERRGSATHELQGAEFCGELRAGAA